MFATRIKKGVMGGIIGGVVFGAMMGMMGMLPMVGKLINQPNAAVGFVLHLIISVGIGAGFGLVLGPLANSSLRSVILGLAYGAFWWVLGPLTLMPLGMGMGLGVNWNLTAAQNMMPSLMGHMIFGLVLGFVYSRGESCLLGRFLGLGKNEDPPREHPVPRVL